MTEPSKFPLSDQELFDFNARQIASYSDEEAHENLVKYGDAFRYQLVAALQLDEWADNLEADPIEMMDPKEVRGWINAIRNIAACLRQGDYLPGGVLFDQTVRGRRSD